MDARRARLGRSLANLMTLSIGALAAIVVGACATIPEPPGGGDNLPNANAGPFRALVVGELSSSLSLLAPYGLDDLNDFGRDIAVVRADDDPASMSVYGYVASAVTTGGVSPTATSPTQSIVRYEALDGRSFALDGTVVLTPDAPWEGGVLAAPAVVRSGGTTRLYYAAAGGIGLARSTDGTTFTKVSGPVLGPVAGGWEQGAVPASPGVVELPDGSYRMFYQVATGPGSTSIGEASSPDGVTWTRLGTAPALAPSGAAGAADDAWETASVGSPFPMLATTADGRLTLRLYYGALDATGNGTIAIAARYGTDGPFQRGVGAVFGTTGALDPREPCVVAFPSVALLYVTEASSTSRFANPAIAVGVAPATAILPPPNPM
jgi:hypothetical protein